MKNLSHKLFTLFCLLVFILPQVEIQIHAFEHANDFHCTSSNKHFHEQEHNCAICDYSLPDAIEAYTASFVSELYSSVFSYSSDYNNNHLSEETFGNAPARAPPVA